MFKIIQFVLCLFIMISCVEQQDRDEVGNNTFVLSNFVEASGFDECAGKEDGETITALFYDDEAPIDGICISSMEEAICEAGEPISIGEFQAVSCNENAAMNDLIVEEEEEEVIDPIIEEIKEVPAVVIVEEEEEVIDPIIEEIKEEPAVVIVEEEEEVIDPVIEEIKEEPAVVIVEEEEEIIDPVIEEIKEEPAVVIVEEEEEIIDPIIEEIKEVPAVVIVEEEEEVIDPVIEEIKEEPIREIASTDEQVCKPSKVLKLGIDKNDDGFADEYIGDVKSYKGKLSAKENYNYYSWSAHPRINIKPRGFANHVYFYEGSDGLTMQFYYNVDGGGSKANKVSVNIETLNNNNQDKVILSDDKAELKLVSSNDDGNLYSGKFRYWSNTDGGVIGPFIGDDFKIIVRPQEYGDNRVSSFYSANGEVYDLSEGNRNYTFIVEYKTFDDCEEKPSDIDDIEDEQEESDIKLGCYKKNYIRNGSFERNSLFTKNEVKNGKQGWGILKKIRGWRTTKKSDAGIELQVSKGSFAGLPARHGYAKIELDSHAKNGFKNSHTHLYQNVKLEKDEVYVLKFAHAARMKADTNQFKVTISKRVKRVRKNKKGKKYVYKAIKEQIFKNRDLNWSVSKIKFLSSGGKYRVSFQGIGKEDSLGGYLDDIKLMNSRFFTDQHSMEVCKLERKKKRRRHKRKKFRNRIFKKGHKR